MKIKALPANSTARTTSYRKSKKQLTAKKQQVAICPPEASLKQELQSLNRLKIAPSAIQHAKGVGSGLFSTENISLCKTPGKLIFKKGDIILEGITGTLAFNHRNTETKKQLEWLYYDGLCMPLSNDSHVLWSPYKVNDLELGVMPDGPVIYMNDSTTPNCKVNVGVKRKFQDNEGITLNAFPNTEIPIEFTIEAAKPIPPDKELLWCYRPEAKRTKKAGKNSSSVNFQAQYLKKKHTPADYLTIQDKTTTAFSDPVSVTITTNFNDIRKQRLKNMEASRRPTKNRHSTTKPLKKYRLNPLALNTYVKHRLNSCNPLSDELITICASFNRNKISTPRKPENNDEDRERWYLHDIYRYCYDQNLISPEDDVMSIPMEWLGKQIEQTKEPLRWLTLLRKSLSIKLLKTRNIASLALTLRHNTPNPLHGYEKSWTPEEVERFAGIIRLTQHVTTPKILDLYQSLYEVSAVTPLSQQVYEAARKGDLDAQKAIIAKRLPVAHMKGLLKNLKTLTGDVDLLVDGRYRTPDKDIVIKFIKQHFNKDQQKNLLGNIAYTDQELLDSLNNKTRHDSSINAEIIRRIRSTDNIPLLKQFITIRLKSIRDLSTLVYRINQAEITYKGQSPFTQDHLCQLFKPGENDTIEKTFQRTTSTDDLFKELLSPGFNTKKTHQQILKRCKGYKDSRDVTLRYIKLCRQYSKKTLKNFCASRASLLNKHEVPTVIEELPVWNSQAIKQIIASTSTSPNTPQCISTTGKAAPATHSAQTIITKTKPRSVNPKRLLAASPMTRGDKLNSIKVAQQPKGKTKYWQREKWCGRQWWSSSSKLTNFAEKHRFHSIQELKKANPALYYWLEEMNQSLTKAKTNKAARELYPNEFKGTVLTSGHINIMVGWINNSLNTMGLANLQDLPFH